MKNARRKFISDRLIYLRKKANLLPRQIADSIGINPKTYSAHEELRSMPDLLRLKAICDFYKITMDQFFNINPQDKEQQPC